MGINRYSSGERASQKLEGVAAMNPSDVGILKVRLQQLLAAENGEHHL